MTAKIPSSLVSVDWLHKHLDAENLIILDATLSKVTANTAPKIVVEEQIQGALFFDIKHTFSDTTAPYPNTVPKPEIFEIAAQDLGITQRSCIVVYDTYGIYSSARVWWLFTLMGFKNIAVLNGGFPEWKRKNYPTELKQVHTLPKGDFKVTYQPKLVSYKQEVLENITTAKAVVIDARAKGRFLGTAPEPRKEVRGGRIPKSESLPYSTLLEERSFKKEKELQQLFQEVNPNGKPMIFSCGSGITACVLALGATQIEHTDFSVYDGSWTEWGSEQELPIV